MYQRILVPIDGSPTARRGLDEAIRLARQTDASLRLFHAIDDPFTALGIDDVVAAPRNIDALLRQNARRIVDEGLAAAARAGVAADDEIEDRLHGPLPDLVAEAARGWRADLIVIGTPWPPRRDPHAGRQRRRADPARGARAGDDGARRGGRMRAEPGGIGPRIGRRYVAGAIPPGSIRTLPELLSWRAAQTPWRPAYSEFDGERNAWREVTWRETDDAVRRISHLFAALRLEHGARVALLLPNCHTAACLDLAVLASGLVPVPMHALDNPASIAYILQDTGAAVLVVDTATQWRAIRALGESPASLQLVLVRRDGASVAGRDGAARIVALDEWMAGPGSLIGSAPRPPGELDLAAIVYTSGTTGRPKGVMLTHANVMANVRACLERFDARVDDLFLSFLPLSHTFERTAGFYLPIAAGSCVAYARSVQTLPEDLLRTRPTILVSVPRIYEKVQAQIEATIARSWPARIAFRCAVAAGWRRHLRLMHQSVAAQWLAPLDALVSGLLDARVGAPLRARFGGRLRVAVSGGAPLALDIARTFIGLGIEIVQGYGMTESAPVVAANAPGDNDPATVGRPLDGVEVRIGDSLELQVRGPNIMRGYWNRPEDTTAAFEDGWLRTGDQAAIEDGRVRILGRIKEIIVTATGEKIAPVDVEQALMRDPLVEQAWVFGEGRPFIGCVLQLQAKEWATLAAGLGLDPDAQASLSAPAAVQAVEARMTARTASLPRHGQPRRAILALEPWTTDNGLLTPTLKLKRRNLQARFDQEIEQLYEA